MVLPKPAFLGEPDIKRILSDAYRLLWEPGVRIYNDAALALLDSAGAVVDVDAAVAHIPLELVRIALSSVPTSFYLYDVDGHPVVHYGGDDVHFDPGSAAIEVLDYASTRSRPPATADLIRAVRLAEALTAFDAVSTCLVSGDVPAAIGDLYRLYIVLRHARKPIITGTFCAETWQPMYEMLVAAAGGDDALAAAPRAIFDVCPLSPLTWSDASARVLVDCARRCVPAQIVAAPQAGATAPVTLLGTLTQHTAETLSGVVIHQLACPGAPLVWGGLPSIFDMHSGNMPTGAAETVTLGCAAAQIGKYLGFPTQAYLGLSDAKTLDAQAGFESGAGIVMGMQAGINMISGPGVLDFVRVFSLEKLAVDAEVIDMARHMMRSITWEKESGVCAVIRAVGHGGDFLSHPHTVENFRAALHMPSSVIDRARRGVWEAQGAQSVADRAHVRVEALLAEHTPPPLPDASLSAIEAIALSAARAHGMDVLPI